MMIEKSETRRDIECGKGVGFQRLRRITGYLVPSLDKWNAAKLAELNERVQHNFGQKGPGYGTDR